MRQAVAYLHEKGLVWGDAKGGNVLVDGQGGAILVDFGGGYTVGWVDADIHGTRAGDLQGLERIIEMIKNKVRP